jgi:hypothetical protein
MTTALARLPGGIPEDFVANPAYGIGQLSNDLERCVFLLGGSPGPCGPQRRSSSRCACGRFTLTSAAAPALTGIYPGTMCREGQPRQREPGQTSRACRASAEALTAQDQVAS